MSREKNPFKPFCFCMEYFKKTNLNLFNAHNSEKNNINLNLEKEMHLEKH